MFCSLFYRRLSLGARAAFKDEDICRLGVLRTLWRGKPFMDYLPPVSPVTLRWKNEAPSRERKETNRERKSETGRGSVQGGEEKSGHGRREESAGKGVAVPLQSALHTRQVRKS